MADVQPLTRQHDRDTFDCGVESLNVFLRSTAVQHQDKGVSRTIVLIDSAVTAPHRILGFFTLLPQVRIRIAGQRRTAPVPAAGNFASDRALISGGPTDQRLEKRMILAMPNYDANAESDKLRFEKRSHVTDQIIFGLKQLSGSEQNLHRYCN